MMIGGVSVSVLLSHQTYIAWIDDPILTTGKQTLKMWLPEGKLIWVERNYKVAQTIGFYAQ